MAASSNLVPTDGIDSRDAPTLSPAPLARTAAMRARLPRAIRSRGRVRTVRRVRSEEPSPHQRRASGDSAGHRDLQAAPRPGHPHPAHARPGLAENSSRVWKHVNSGTCSSTRPTRRGPLQRMTSPLAAGGDSPPGSAANDKPVSWNRASSRRVGAAPHAAKRGLVVPRGICVAARPSREPVRHGTGCRPPGRNNRHAL